MKNISILLFFLVILNSCNKDQRAVNKLDGKWKATSYSGVNSSGLTADFLSYGYNFIFDFNGCVLEEDQYCEHKRTTILNGDTLGSFTYLYKVAGDGVLIELKDTSSLSDLTTLIIHKLTNKVLVISEEYNNASYSMEFEKIK